MTPITIPQKLIAGDDLVVLSRKEYEQIVNLAKKRGYTSFNQRLHKIVEEVKQGKIIGPFRTAKALKVSLEK